MNGSPPFLTSRTQNNISDRIRWKNLAAESVPAYGVVRLTGYDGTDREHQIAKPDGSPSLYYVNGPVAVAANKRGGSALWNTPLAVLTNAAETLAVGDIIGPVDAQWYMSNAGSGFQVFSPPNGDNIAVVERVSSGSGDGVVVCTPTDVVAGIGFACDGVAAEVIAAPCNSGIAAGDSIDVFDINRSFLQMPPELLFGGIVLYVVKIDFAPTYGTDSDCNYIVIGASCTEDLELV